MIAVCTVCVRWTESVRVQPVSTYFVPFCWTLNKEKAHLPVGHVKETSTRQHGTKKERTILHINISDLALKQNHSNVINLSLKVTEW